MAPAPRAVVPAAERGATRIADRVVAKIAARAAREVLDAPPEGGRAPHAEVTVHGPAARVWIGLELGYPSDIGGQCALVRRQVTDRVGELTGMTVPEVTVLVERLYRADPESRRTR
ncbi:hypothetical protein [Streptomyces sp. NPDC048442]|uniref:hypothetical protein n=1 Tax=Streptomyces sp. NPDC048442 TaxID=3154823 RepID=UPI00343657DB